MNNEAVLDTRWKFKGIACDNVNPKRRLGQFGESFAIAYLCGSLGWTLIDKNWRCRAGELDIVAREGLELVFVEVRTRRNTVPGTVLEAVGAAKLRQLRRVVPYALQSYRPTGAARLDVVLLGVTGWTVCELHHMRNIQL